MRPQFLIVLFFCLLSACTTPTATPGPTLTPTITPTPFVVAALPTTDAELTVTPTRSPTPPRDRTTTPAPPVFGVTRGAAVYTQSDSAIDQIRALELHPTEKELLISLYNGATAQVDRVRWDSPEPRTDRLPGELLQPRYAPDGTRIVADGLIFGAITGPFAPLTAPNTQKTPIPQAIDGVAPSWSPDGKQIAFIRRSVPLETPPGVGSLPVPGQPPPQGQPSQQPPQPPPQPPVAPGGPPVGVNCTGQDVPFCAALVLLDVATGQEKTIVSRPYLDGPAEWSPDQARVLVNMSGEVGSALAFVELASGTLTQLIPSGPAPDEANSYVTALWLDNDRVLYATQDSALWILDVRSGLPIKLIDDAERPHLIGTSGTVVYLKPLPSPNFAARAYELWQVQANDPKSAIPISRAALACNNATWSRDGNTLACVDVGADGRRAVLLYGVIVNESGKP